MTDRWAPRSVTSRCARRSTTPSTARRSWRASRAGTARSPPRCSAPTAPASIPPSTSSTRTTRRRPRQLLADAGYADGFTLDLPQAAALGEPIFATIGDQLGAIGIDVNFTDESSDYFGAILAPKYPSFFMILEQAPNDWQFVNFLLSEDAVWNPSHYSDATSDELISTIQTTEGEEQEAAVAELGKYVAEQAWFAPWYRVEANYATDSNVDVQIQTGNAVPYLFNFSPQG